MLCVIENLALGHSLGSTLINDVLMIKLSLSFEKLAWIEHLISLQYTIFLKSTYDFYFNIILSNIIEETINKKEGLT